MSTIYNLASITFLKGTYQKVHAQAMLFKVGAKWLQFSVNEPLPPHKHTSNFNIDTMKIVH